MLPAFADNFNYSTRESHDILSRLIKSFPNHYNHNGLIENTHHSIIVEYEKGFFEALALNEYLHPSGRKFTDQEKREIHRELIQISNKYIENRNTLYTEYNKFEADTYSHILRNQINRTQIAIQLEKLNYNLSKFHDAKKLIADVSELHKAGYPMEISATILDFLVANQQYRKDDARDGTRLLMDNNGDVFRLPLAFAIHEVNRIEKLDVYNFFLNAGLAVRISANQIKLSAKAILAEVYDIITDHEDAVSRKDLGNPKELTSASKYLSNLKKTPARELKSLLEALGTDLNKIQPIFDYFEAHGYKKYQSLVSDKINKIKEYTRGLSPKSLSCIVLFN